MNGAVTAPCNNERRRKSSQPLFILPYQGCRSQRQVQRQVFSTAGWKTSDHRFSTAGVGRLLAIFFCFVLPNSSDVHRDGDEITAGMQQST